MSDFHLVKKKGRASRFLQSVGLTIASPKIMKKGLFSGYLGVMDQGLQKLSPLLPAPLSSLIDPATDVHLKNFALTNGNSSYFELIALSSIAAYNQPRNIVEIGTFNGVSTLHFALNTAPDARIHTLDLPPNHTMTDCPILDTDVQHVVNQEKYVKRYHNTAVANKIVEHLGDSTTYDFSIFGGCDLAFIDGGHSYECVKKDTEKMLEIMNQRGIILWHDYSLSHPEVFEYLNALAKDYPLQRIEETTLAYLSLS